MENDEIIIDLGALFRTLLKRWAFIAKVTALFLMVAVAYLLKAKPVYESKSLLQLKQPESAIKSALSNIYLLDVQRTKQLVSTYGQIIVSTSVVMPVIEKLTEQDESGQSISEKAFVKKISAQQMKDTNILEVCIKDNDPARAKYINDLLIASFMSRLTKLAKEEYKESREFLEKQVVVAKQNLDDADAAVKTFNQDHNMSSPKKEMEFVMDQRSQLRKSLQENEIYKIATQKKIDLLNERIKRADKISSDVKNELVNLKVSLSVTESQIEEINRYLQNNQKRVNELLDLNLNINDLMLKLGLANDIYKMLAKRLEEAKVAEESTAKGVQIITEGTLNTVPVKPRKHIILAGAIFMGIFCSCGFIVLVELINKKVENADDVANYLELSVLGNIPDFNSTDGETATMKVLCAKLGRLVWGK